MIVLLLAMLVIALDYYVQSDAFSARLRPYILSPLQEMLGPVARIGMIKANAVPLYIEVRDVFVPDASGIDAVQVRKLRVYINPFPLVLKRISLPTITLLEPHIRSTRNTTGDLSLMQMADRIKTAAGERQKKGPSRFTVDPGTIRIHRGTIDFLDEASETTLSVSGLSMNVRFKTPANNIRMSVQSASVRIAAKAQPALIFDLRGRAEYGNDKLTLTSLELLAPDGKITASGSMGTVPDGSLDLTMKGRFGQKTLGRFSALLNKKTSKGLRPLIDLAVSAKGRMTEPVVDGAVTLYNIPYKTFTVQEAGLTFSYRNNLLSLTGKQWKIARARTSMVVDSVTAILDHRAPNFDIKKLEIIAGDLVARATGSIDGAKGYNAELSFESNGKSRTLSFLTGVSLEGTAALHGRLTGELFSPVFDGSLSAGPVTIKDILFHDAAGKMQFRDKKLSFSSVDIHQLGSRYILDGSIDFSRENIFYAARLNVVRSDVASVVSLFYRPLPLQLSATGEITFIGTSKDFDGNATLNVGPGSAYGESFSKGSLTVALTPERVSFPQVVVHKGGGVVEGNGWIGFNRTYAAQLTSRGVNLSDVDHLSGISLSGPFNLEINSSGPFSALQLKSTLTLDDLRYRQVSMGACKATLGIDAGMMTVEADLPANKTRLAGSMDLRPPYAWSASADLRSADIAPLIIPPGSEALSRVKIVADGRVAAQGRGTSPLLSGSAVFQQLSFALGDYRLENEGDAVINMEAGKLLVKALSFTGTGTRMAVTGSLRIKKDYDLACAGKANLSLLRLFYREVEHGDGNADVKLTVRGSWDDPEIAGELRLENGEIKIKDVPQKFSALNGTIDYQPGTDRC